MSGNEWISYNFGVIDDNFMIAERELRKLSRNLSRNSRNMFLLGAVSTGILMIFCKNLKEKQVKIDELSRKIDDLEAQNRAMKRAQKSEN